MKKACFFDLDGTLVDSLADLAHSVNHCLEEAGHSPLPIERYQILVGGGIRNLCEKALGDAYGIEEAEVKSEEVDALLKAFTAYYQTRLTERTRPYEGVLKCLEQLRSKGLLMGILSNKREDMTQEIVKTLFPDFPFAFVAGMREDWPKKPDPSRALALCRELGLKPEAVYMVGDSKPDMQLGVRAGFHPIGVSWGFRSREELWENGAEQVLDTVEELEAFLSSVMD